MDIEDFIGSDKVRKPFCVLIGHPVGHSLSPFIQNTAAMLTGMDWKYEAVDVRPESMGLLGEMLRMDNFCGANITIPYKRSIIPYLDERDELSQRLDAVNTIYRRNGKLLGTNTDVYGFKQSLNKYVDDIVGKDAIVFGTGGASRAVIFALDEIGIKRTILVSRNPGKTMDSFFAGIGESLIVDYNVWVNHVDGTGIVVNATPLGMEPDINSSPVDPEYVSCLNGKICYDIVYKPQDTRFLQQALDAGGIPIGGLDMLIGQGGRSFEYWTGCEFPYRNVKDALMKFLNAKD